MHTHKRAQMRVNSSFEYKLRLQFLVEHKHSNNFNFNDDLHECEYRFVIPISYRTYILFEISDTFGL